MMDKLVIDRKKTMKRMSVQDWPTIGDASESSIIKFFEPIE